MIILGIALSHNASASLMINGKIIIVAQEEDEQVVSLVGDTDVELRVQRRSIGEIISKAGEETEDSDEASDED